MDRSSTDQFERLRRRALRYEALAASPETVVWVIDPQLRPTGRNEAWERYTGQTAQSYEQHGWLAAIHPDDHERVRLEAARAQSTGSPLKLEVRIHRADGAYRRNLVHA